MSLDLPEDSPLQDWTNNSKGMGENDYEWINESENITIRIEKHEDKWNIALYNKIENLNGHYHDETVTSLKAAKEIADKFAQNYEKILDNY